MELNGVLPPSDPTRPLKLYLVGLEGRGAFRIARGGSAPLCGASFVGSYSVSGICIAAGPESADTVRKVSVKSSKVSEESLRTVPETFW